MRWMAPPDKREITLILLSLTIYFLAYNVDTSLEILGIDPTVAKGAVFSRLGLKNQVIGKDGRKPPGWRDSLEAEIFGEWPWDEGHVAGNGQERSQRKGTGRHGATWKQQGRSNVMRESVKQPFGELTVSNALLRWGGNLPQTEVVRHVSGYTILDNVYFFNGTVYLISDSAKSFPPMSSMVVSTGIGFREWKVLSMENGHKVVGDYGAPIRGVSWMSADTKPHNSTLFALWRTYSSLDETIDSSGRTKLPPPQRLIFPHNRFFTDANPPFENHWIRRRRVDTGFHPYLAKAAFPHLAMLYFEDWEDYQKMEVPFVFERLVVADRGIGTKAAKEGEPPYSPTSFLDLSENWWEPVRKSVAQFLDGYEFSPKAKRVLTYLHSQSEQGPKLSSEDHQALVKALQRLAYRYGYELYVISTETGWVERMGAVVTSSIILGVHGDHLMESIFMRRTPQSTLLELFPLNKFVRDRQYSAHAIGLNYIAVQGNATFTSSKLPPVAPPQNEPIEIDMPTIIRSIHEALSRPTPQS